MKYRGDRLSIAAKVKLSPTLYSLLERESWKDQKTNSEMIRGAITKMLMDRGVTIPKPMSIWDRLDAEAGRTTTTTTTAIIAGN